MQVRITAMLRILALTLFTIGFSVIAQAQTLAYVGNFNLNNVSVIDTATNSIVTTIPVGTKPTQILASPDGSRVYVANTTPNFVVSVIDTATNTVVATIPTPGAGFFMAMPADGTRIYVNDFLFPSSGVSVIDTATNTVVASIPMPAGSRPRGLTVSPDGTRLYVADLVTGNIYIADTAANAVVDFIPSPSGTQTIAVILSKDGSKLYAGNGAVAGEVGVFDTATKVLLASLPTGVGQAAQFSISPDGSKIYATGIVGGGPYVVIDTATNTPTTLAPIDGAWVYAAITPDNAFAYINDYLHSQVAVVDNTSNALITTIPLAAHSNPWGIVITTLPLTTPFASFRVGKLDLNRNGFHEDGSFSLSAPSTHSLAPSAAGGTIDPVTQPVVFTIGSYVLTIPAGSFREDGKHLHWKFDGTINGVRLNIQIEQHGNSTTQFDYKVEAKGGPVLTGLPRPITVGLKIGTKTGSAIVP